MSYIISTDIHGKEYKVALDELKWRPSCYGIVVHDNKILLTKQYDKYHLPGGGVDLGEMPDQTVVREVKEETGLEVANPQLVKHISGFFSFNDEYDPELALKHVQTILLFFACEYVGGELSTKGFTDYEKGVGELAEWIPLADIDLISAGSTIDWRSVVKEVLDLG